MNQVKQTLERLRQQLDAGAALDDATRAELVALEADIQRALGGSAQPGLRERARELSLRFSAQHPTAAAVLQELGTLLEGIGA